MGVKNPRPHRLPVTLALGAATTLAAAGAWAGPALAAPAHPGTSSPGASPAVLMGTKARPGLKNCGLYPVTVKPRTLVLSCADANSQGKDLVWSQWGPTKAAATGVFTWNVCKPNCAASKTWGTSRATYTLSHVARTAKYGWLYEELTVHITGKQTGGFPRTITYPQKPMG